jgi:uncharacterized protein
MTIEWDQKTARANIKEHGVSFEEALTVLFDPSHIALVFEDDHSKEFRVGISDIMRVLLVVTVELPDNGGDRVLCIKEARKATRSERMRYEEGL